MTEIDNSLLVPLVSARSRLATIWFTGSGVLFLILLATSWGSVFQGQLQQVWSTSLAAVMPTLSLILSVLGANAIVKLRKKNNKADSVGDPSQMRVRRDFYRITVGLSVGYLLLVIVSFFAHPFVTAAQAPDVSSEKIMSDLHATDQGEMVEAADEATPADFVVISNLWLAPIQGLVVGALGVLFFTKKE